MIHAESLSGNSLPINALFVAADAAYILELSHSYTLRLTLGPSHRTTCCYGNAYQWLSMAIIGYQLLPMATNVSYCCGFI